jgi:hypothetical protein
VSGAGRTESSQLDRATWLLGLIVKRMTPRPDGSAHVDLSAPMAEGIREFVAERADWR